MIEEMSLCQTELAARELAAKGAREVIENYRERLRRRFGWVAIDATASVDASRRRINIKGRSLLHRLSSALHNEVSRCVGGTWKVQDEIVVSSGDFDHFFEDRVEIWREHPADGGTEHLTTEWLRTDGPVQTLTVVRGAALIRTSDGTVGWTIGIPTRLERPSMGDARRRSDWSTEALSFLGVPYRLGGTTRDGIDCSGLTQRLARIVLDRTIPRHSSDQAALLRVRRSIGHGDLVFTTDGESPHVGVALQTHGTTHVIHASSSRGRVVSDELETYLALTKGAGLALIGTIERM